MQSKNIADLNKDQEDAMGDKILVFYGYKPPSYAVYRTDKRVVI